MTNQQLALLLMEYEEKLANGIFNAEQKILAENPQLKNIWGKLNSEAFFLLKHLDRQLNEKINLLSTTYP